ncbi:methyltransferase type 11 [Bacillus luti]|uniref:YkvA family protein n=1 Tax=Bacillus luti TaxID=2026191 RepID=UPI0008FE1E81|nr:YkvA family protein [Bacillus luti]OJE51695.1 methyltransferase type 11 [Bacillus luti]
MFNKKNNKGAFDSKKIEKENKKYQNRASAYLEDESKIQTLIQKGMKISQNNKGALTDVWDNLQVLFEMMNCWRKGEYREISKKSLLAIVGAILYFVSPIDLIPDFILGLGLIDDVAIISLAIKQVSSDIEKFKEWKNELGNEDNVSNFE